MVNQNTRKAARRISEWSSGAMLLTGMMGTRTPAEKLYAIRCSLALLILLFWPVSLGVTGFWVRPWWFKTLVGTVPGIVALYIVWQFRIYLKSLDELARKVQYESMAWTYLFGMILWGFLFGLTAVGGWHFPGFRLLALAWVLVLEPIRGILLYKFAHRY